MVGDMRVRVRVGMGVGAGVVDDALRLYVLLCIVHTNFCAIYPFAPLARAPSRTVDC